MAITHQILRPNVICAPKKIRARICSTRHLRFPRISIHTYHQKRGTHSSCYLRAVRGRFGWGQMMCRARDCRVHQRMRSLVKGKVYERGQILVHDPRNRFAFVKDNGFILYTRWRWISADGHTITAEMKFFFFLNCILYEWWFGVPAVKTWDSPRSLVPYIFAVQLYYKHINSFAKCQIRHGFWIYIIVLRVTLTDI